MGMSFLFVVSHPLSQTALLGLTRACTRKGLSFRCFFTGDGVSQLADSKTLEAIAAAQRNVVCEHSWAKHFPDRDPPVEQGSQTVHSALAGEAATVVSL